jgi:hypothetical protein
MREVSGVAGSDTSKAKGEKKMKKDAMMYCCRSEKHVGHMRSIPALLVEPNSSVFDFGRSKQFKTSLVCEVRGFARVFPEQETAGMAVNDVVLKTANGCVDHVFAGEEVEGRDRVVVKHEILG